MTSPLFNPMKRNPMKPQLQDSLKPVLENEFKKEHSTNSIKPKLYMNNHECSLESFLFLA